MKLKAGFIPPSYASCARVLVLAASGLVGGAFASPPDETLRNQYPGTPMPGLTKAELRRFDQGQALFSRLWTVADGLGPKLNANSCAACHHNPLPGGNEFAVARFVAHSMSCNDPVGGKSCFRLEFVGSVGSKTRPVTLPLDATFRKPQSLFGIGMLEAVSEHDIVALASAQELDPDGVRGKPGRSADGRLGRFGWKARFASVRDFVASAFRAEFDMTSVKYPGADKSTARAVSVQDRTLRRTSDFVRMLAAPPLTPRGDILHGRDLFASLRCDACHVPSMRTARSDIRTISNRNFYAYTDMLLHDMGDALADGIVEGSAGSASFRTPPLWGLNASGPPYLHDGRAKSVREAIELHGGEAGASVARFEALSPSQAESLLRFLDHL